MMNDFNNLIPISSVSPKYFQCVIFESNQWRLCTFKITSKSFQKQFLNYLGQDSNRLGDQKFQDIKKFSSIQGFDFLGDYVQLRFYLKICTPSLSNRLHQGVNQLGLRKLANFVLFRICIGFAFSYAHLPSFICTSFL